MNKDKAKCEYLKEIRRVLAEKLGIDLHQKECKFEGDCGGTCPKCEQEEMLLNEALSGKERPVLHDLEDAVPSRTGSIVPPIRREVKMGKFVPVTDDDVGKFLPPEKDKDE